MIRDFLSELAGRLPTSDFYVSLPFWGYFAAAVFAYRLIPPQWRLKNWLLLASSVCMLLTLPRFSFTALGILMGVCLITYSCARLLIGTDASKHPSRRKVLAAAGIIVNVLVLAFFKYSLIQDAILNRRSVTGSTFIFLIGISYTAFRAMHFVIEAYKNEIKRPTLLTFFNYMLFFPAFISGPIHRYNPFVADSDKPREAPFRADLAAGMERVIHGLFKKIVLTVIIFPYTLKNMGIPLEEMSFWQIALGLYAFALYLYFDFAGYTDMAIGAGRIMGFTLPENFNRPFLKENIQQLWANFHMSLTSWLTEYVYWPLARKLRAFEYLRNRPILLSNFAIIVTFIVCGIWHGDTLVFVVWGLYQGIGLSAVNIYQKWKRKVRNPRLRAYFRSSWSYAVGVVGTFTFFSAGLLFFVLETDEMIGLLARFILTLSRVPELIS
jgi:alginate O-acetyltransferase complex protein AlgI